VTPTIVVAMPVYNAASIIGPTLESLAAQTEREFEALVCDNASTDDTVKLVEAFADRRGLRVTLVRHGESRGRLGNWAFCIDHVLAGNAEWLKWLFAGDRLLPSAMASLRAEATRHTDVGLIVTDYQVRDGARVQHRRALREAARLRPADAVARYARDGNWFGAPLGQMYHRRGLEGAVLGDLEWVADCRLALHAAARHPVQYSAVEIGIFETEHRRHYRAAAATAAAAAEECVMRHHAIDVLRRLDPTMDVAELRAAADRALVEAALAPLADGEVVDLGLRRGLGRWLRASVRRGSARIARRLRGGG
jgi:hypothetical protein